MKFCFKPRIIICIPFGITQVEKRAVKESAEQALADTEAAYNAAAKEKGFLN